VTQGKSNLHLFIGVDQVLSLGVSIKLKPKRKEGALVEFKTVKIQILRIENKGMLLGREILDGNPASLFLKLQLNLRI
jgi:hypothetical protein